MKNTLLLLSLLFSTALFAQRHIPDAGIQEKMSALHYLAGNWAGDGWIIQRDGQKHDFTQTERIEFKLDSTLLLVEGRGIAKGDVIHNALALISFDKENDRYVFTTHLPDGTHGSYDAEFIGDHLYWYPAPEVRYIISMNEKGQWVEKGEFKRDEGWFQFFEMTLNKI